MSGQKDRSWFVGYGEPAGRYIADDGGPLGTQPAPDPLLDQMAEALAEAEKHLESWPHSLGAEYSGLPAIRAALAPYREKTDE